MMQFVATFPDILQSNGKPLVLADEFIVHSEAWRLCWKFCEILWEEFGLSPCVISEEFVNNNLCSLGDQEKVMFASIHLFGVNGGKGGFGAQLRSLAKQKGAKRTTDFGACRDLSGRRLRNVNHEIILSKWIEAKEKGETFNVEQDTSTGIELWFMSAPSWADGIKADKRKKFLKSRFKNSLCSDWMRARETSIPPKGAPLFWGCPRGPKCEFAHGEDELRGAGKDRYFAVQHDEQLVERSKQRDDYLLPIEKAAKREEEVIDMISEGLQLAKRAKRKEMAVATSVESTTKEYAQVLSGTMIAERQFDGIVLTGCSSFSTCVFYGFPCAGEGHFFFEVELLTNGLMQIGWCDSNFDGGNEEAGDGVGDDQFSWAFDGFRQMFIHEGQESEYVVGSNENVWEAGDIVSCCLTVEDLEENTEFVNIYIAFALQGLFPSQSSVKKFQRKRGDACFYPSISCESSESVVVNIRQKPFAFHHLAASLKSMYWDSVKLENRTEVTDTQPLPQPEILQETDVDIDWNLISSVSDLTKFSGDVLKKELIRRGMKFGGTVEQKADRLFKAVNTVSHR